MYENEENINYERNDDYKINQDDGYNEDNNNNYLIENIVEKTEEYSNKENDGNQDNSKNEIIEKKEYIVNNINKTPLKIENEENKKYMESMMDVLEEASGKKGKSSSGKKPSNK